MLNIFNINFCTDANIYITVLKFFCQFRNSFNSSCFSHFVDKRSVSKCLPFREYFSFNKSTISYSKYTSFTKDFMHKLLGNRLLALTSSKLFSELTQLFTILKITNKSRNLSIHFFSPFID